MADAEQAAVSAKQSATEARATATTHIAALGAQITALADTIALTREQTAGLAADVKARLAAEQQAGHHYDRCKEDKDRAEEAAERAQQAGDLTGRAEQQGWPARFDLARRLRPAVAADTTRQPALEKQYQEVQEEYERLARDAQSEIIKGAKLVATTLARFRTNRAVFEGPYDVVLVD